MEGVEIFPQTVDLRGSLEQGMNPVGVSVAVLRLVAEHLFRRDAIVEQTWRVETTFVLVFFRTETPTHQFDLHMTLITAAKFHRHKQARLEDLHFTLRKSLWNPKLEKYIGSTANSKHYNLLAGVRDGKWAFSLRENREAGNNQRDDDSELLSAAQVCNVSKAIETFLEVLESLAEEKEIEVSGGSVDLRRD